MLICKIYQGLLRAEKLTIDTRNKMLRLWTHECFRVFADRLINAQDMSQFIEILEDKLALYFDQTFHNLCPSRSSPVFVDVLNQDMAYEDIVDMTKLRKGLNQFLEDYNNSPGIIPMDLVLFKDAMEHSKLNFYCCLFLHPERLKPEVVSKPWQRSQEEVFTIQLKGPSQNMSRWVHLVT